jgi:hypothetical protein
MKFLQNGMVFWHSYGEKSIAVDQSTCIGRILDRFGMSTANGLPTSMIPGLQFISSGKSAEEFKFQYSLMVGAVMCVMNFTRSYFANLLSVLMRYPDSYGQKHCQTMNRV